MEIEHSPDGIVFNKELNELDEFVFRFIRILDGQRIRYCLISGYVVILFGRSRATEDVDIFIEKLDKQRFLLLWKALSAEFECIIISDPERAYDDYLNDGLALRFSNPNEHIPNMEMKFANNPINQWTLENRQKVVLNGSTIYISPIEIQIPFKLKLGSEKDIEDAIHLNVIFRDHLDREVFNSFIIQLEQQENYRRYLHG